MPYYSPNVLISQSAVPVLHSFGTGHTHNDHEEFIAITNDAIAVCMEYDYYIIRDGDEFLVVIVCVTGTK